MRLSPAAEAFLHAAAHGLAVHDPSGRRPANLIKGTRRRSTSRTIIDLLVILRMIEMEPGPPDIVRAWKATERGRAYLARNAR